MSVTPKMNPNIRTVEVGIKELRSVKLYPLSVADQFTTTDLLTGLISEFNPTSNAEIAGQLTTTLKENLPNIIEMVTDPKESFTIAEIDNMQLSEIITAIFEANFEGMLKNFKSLFERAKGLFQSKRSLQPSVNTTVDTDSKTSIESPILQEDQQ